MGEDRKASEPKPRLSIDPQHHNFDTRTDGPDHRPSLQIDPKHHDFDKRTDGPEHRPSAAMAHQHSSYDNEKFETPAETPGANSRPILEEEVTNPGGVSSPPEYTNSPTAASPTDPAGGVGVAADERERRHSSLQRWRSRGASGDFDRRTDGPFSRPSITMARRKSSGLPTSPEHPNENGHHASEPMPLNVETMQSSSDPAFAPIPPPLNYTLRTRKLTICIFWGLTLLDSVAMPIGLYFGLWYGGYGLSPNTVFSIVTAALGGVSIIEYFLRWWSLWKKNSTCRPLGAGRWYLDWFHWNFSTAWLIIMIELIVGSTPENPPIRLLSMPVSTMCFFFGTELMVADTMRLFNKPSPIRISSIPAGAQIRPCLYSLVEDLCAVDGGGGQVFRERLNTRYEASHVFRAMLRRLGIFWAVGAQLIATLTTILVFTLPEDPAYVVGWSVPFIWAGWSTICTFWYVFRMLKIEKRVWAEEVAAKVGGLEEASA